MRVWLCGATAVCIALAGDASANSFEETLRKGIREYGTAMFRLAVRTLAGVASAAKNRATKIAAEKYLVAAHLATGNYRAARDSVTRSLEIDPLATVEPGRFPPRVFELFEEVRRSLRGKIRTTCNRPEARVAIDGQSEGKCGEEAEVSIGRHIVRGVAPDEPSQAHEVVVRVGAIEEVTFRFSPGVGFLSVTTTPPEASVWLDGKPLAVAPLTRVMVPVGKHEISVRLDGFKTRRETIEIARGVEFPLKTALEKIVPPEKPKPPEVPPPRGTTMRVEDRPAPPPISKARRIVGWTLVGTGGATFIAGIALQVYASRESSRKESENASEQGNNTASDMRNLESLDRVAKGLMIGGAVVGVVGVVTLLLRRSPPVSTRTGFQAIEIGAIRTLGTQATGVAGRWRF